MKKEVEEMKALQDAINMRIEKIKLHQDSIDKLTKINQIDRKTLDAYYEVKYKKHK